MTSFPTKIIPILLIVILILILKAVSLGTNYDELPNWLTNQTIQSQIAAIFDGIDHIDLVLDDHYSNRSNQAVDHLIHRGGDQVFMQWKTIRIYKNIRPKGDEEGCTGDRSILSAIVEVDDSLGSDELEASQLDVIDRDYEDEMSFIGWERSYESFAKIWDQNHHYGYVVLTSWSTFQASMKCLLDPVATYLVVLSSPAGFNREELSNLFSSVWIHEGVYRVFFLVGTQIYTFDPFLANGSNYGVLKELKDVTDIPSVPRSDFNGYPLRIDMFRSTYSATIVNEKENTVDFFGGDVEASREFAKALNLTPDYLPPDKDGFGFKLPNGSFNGVIGHLSRRESDIVFVGFFIKDYYSRDVEFTSGIYTDELCCLVKKASRVPEYLLPITIFPADLWGLLFLMGIICSITWIVLRAGIQAKARTGVRWAQRRRLAFLFNLSSDIRDARLYRKMIQIFVDTYIILVSGPYQRFTRSGIERLMLFGIMMVSLIFVSMFQSSLSSVFLNPVYYKDIESLQQLDESGVKIPVKYKGFMDDVFPANSSPLMDSLRDKMVYSPTSASMLDRVAHSKAISTVTRKTTLSLDNAIFMSTKQLFMVPECPRLYNLAYVMPRHSVLMEVINQVLLRMLNGGLINHWIDVMNFNVTIKNWEQMRNADEENFKILTLIDMQFPFYLLVIGLLLSGAVFVIEKVYERLAAQT
ncbi:uncharacterized protein LOC135700824 [Ochlerotatus camptorhynchus]|uniref:uncharacterized protein LOC135700824 n=1 Tax=Ochlerotatus camptorhynchus TaxID=644619 RepID=UPI0031DCD219